MASRIQRPEIRRLSWGIWAYARKRCGVRGIGNRNENIRWVETKRTVEGVGDLVTVAGMQDARRMQLEIFCPTGKNHD